jgi:NADH-quinone oxidoreductase subunit K
MQLLNIFKSLDISHYIYLSTVLFSIGMFGVLFRRNAIVLLMCIELMLNAVNLLMVAFSEYMGDAQANGQMFVFFIMVVAAAEAAVGLAIIVMVYRNTRKTDVSFLDSLKD